MRDNLVNMRKYLTIIYIAVFILCLFQLFTGCGGKSEPPPKAVAVSKKIVSKKSVSAPSSSQTPAVVVKEEIVDGKDSIKSTSAEEMNDKILMVDDKKQLQISSGHKVDKQPPSAVSKITEKPSNIDKIDKVENQKAEIATVDADISAINLKEHIALPVSQDEIAKLQPEGIITYNPEGKTDPFAPLFKEGAAAEKGKRTRTIRTPLELVDLDQLKLVAIMLADSGNRALVEEASGKGYVISKGTYIGNNSGRIVKILNDRIIVEEEIENIIGEKKIQERELKLQKPLGEE